MEKSILHEESRKNNLSKFTHFFLYPITAKIRLHLCAWVDHFLWPVECIQLTQLYDIINEITQPPIIFMRDFCSVERPCPACSGPSASDFPGRSWSSSGRRATGSENPEYRSFALSHPARWRCFAQIVEVDHVKLTGEVLFICRIGTSCKIINPAILGKTAGFWIYRSVHEFPFFKIKETWPKDENIK